MIRHISGQANMKEDNTVTRGIKNFERYWNLSRRSTNITRNFWIPRFSNFNSRLQSAICRH